MSGFFKKLCGAALVVCAALCLSLGLAACEKTVKYSVTVVCSDESVLGGIGVALSDNGGVAAEKALKNGKAEFHLKGDEYTVILTGVPADYGYKTAVLNETSPDATISLEKKGAEEETAVYTVSVTCGETSVLDRVRVRLTDLASGETAAEKPLENGKAEFELKAGEYTVTLTGVPADYGYESVKLTPDAREAIIALFEKAPAGPFDLAVLLPDGTDYFGRSCAGGPLAGARVSLFASLFDLDPVAAAMTDAEGTAHFEKLKSGKYFVNIGGKDCGECTAAPGGSANFTLNGKYGSDLAPIPWTVGANALPFTEAILDELGDNGYVYCAFTASEGGLYSFDADSISVNVESELFPDGLIGTNDHATATLEGGVKYLFKCTSSGSSESGFGYNVTISEGNSRGEEGDDPSVPWTGAGTKSSPYAIKSLKGNYSVRIPFENGAFSPVYFAYTETKAAKYAVYSSDEDFHLSIGELNYTSGGTPSSAVSLFETETGAEYTLVLTPFDEEVGESIVVSFTIGDFTGWVPKWEGKGQYQKEQTTPPIPKIDDPYLVTVLADDYEVHCNVTRVYFKYEATESREYKVVLTGDVPLDFWLRNYNGGDADSGVHYSLGAKGKAETFTLKAGTVYLFGVEGNDQNSEPHEMILLFKIEEGEAVVPPPAAQPDGTQERPYPFGAVPGAQSVETTSGGVWYCFTATENATYLFTMTSAGWLTIEGKNLLQPSAPAAGKGKTYSLTVTEGKTYSIKIATYGGAEKGTVSFTVTKVPDSGANFAPSAGGAPLAEAPLGGAPCGSAAMPPEKR